MKTDCFCSNCQVSYHVRWNSLLDAEADDDISVEEEELFPSLCPFCGSTSDEYSGE